MKLLHKNLSFFELILVLNLLGLTSCAEFNAENTQAKDIKPQPVVPTPSYFDNLLDFSFKVSTLSPTARTELCKSLLKRQKEASNVDIQIQLTIARLFSDSCGDIPKLLDALNTSTANSPVDEQTQKLLGVSVELLKRLNTTSKSLTILERKQKSLQMLLDSKGKEEPNNTKNDAKLLRDKLEAIRAMEKQLDNPSENN
jgi:hypothetical protein